MDSSPRPKTFTKDALVFRKEEATNQTIHELREKVKNLEEKRHTGSRGAGEKKRNSRKGMAHQEEVAAATLQHPAGHWLGACSPRSAEPNKRPVKFTSICQFRLRQFQGCAPFSDAVADGFQKSSIVKFIVDDNDDAGESARVCGQSRRESFRRTRSRSRS